MTQETTVPATTVTTTVTEGTTATETTGTETPMDTDTSAAVIGDLIEFLLL